MTTYNSRSLTNFYLSYKLGSLIGRGGYGTVYSGTRVSDNLPVAVKFISRKYVPEWSHTETGDHKIPLEITVMKRLSKVSGCVQLLDWFECSESFILIMERPFFCKDLFDIISESVCLNETQSRIIYKQVIQTLIEMKKLHIIHGDIKDENIIIDLSNNTAKLIDFGASSFDQEEDYTEFYGTTVYAPPEWFLYKRYNGVEGSVWSLGILLYSMICGDVPFENETQVTEAKLNFRRNCSDECKDLIRRCLSVEPKNRPSIEDILAHSWFRDR